MPYPDLEQSVCCLDASRLGNQVYREALSLLRGGWSNHPAAKLWSSYKPALAQYCIYGLRELVRRNKRPPTHISLLHEFKRYMHNKPIILPPFIGNIAFHISHMDNLIFPPSIHPITPHCSIDQFQHLSQNISGPSQ
jgi:hypothetical protein